MDDKEYYIPTDEEKDEYTEFPGLNQLLHDLEEFEMDAVTDD